MGSTPKQPPFDPLGLRVGGCGAGPSAASRTLRRGGSQPLLSPLKRGVQRKGCSKLDAPERAILCSPMGRPLPQKQRQVLEQQQKGMGASPVDGPATVVSERGKWGVRSFSPSHSGWLDPAGIHGTCIQCDVHEAAIPRLDQLELQTRMIDRIEALSATDLHTDLLPGRSMPAIDLRPETAPEAERYEVDDGRPRATSTASGAGTGLCRPHVMDLTAEASRFIDNK